VRRIEALAKSASVCIEEFTRVCDSNVDYSRRVIGSMTFSTIACALLLVGLIHDGGVIFSPT